MRKPTTLLIVLLTCAGLPAHAKVYKWVMPDGSIQYSDRPQGDGAKQVELPPIQTYSAPPVLAPAAGETDEKAAAAATYEVVEVVAPKAGEVIRDNVGTISVQLKLEPALRSGHKVEILLDGKSIGSGRATSASVTNVDRGSHTVSAVIKDESGATVATAPGVAFDLKRSSKLQPARRPVPTPLPKGS